MSILAGPFERRIVHTIARDDEEEDLLVFGYACKLYRDDTKALMEDSGQLLIPWMGDHSLMVDRYDVRNRLEDKNQFGLKSNLPYRPTAEEVELEEELDRERYLALENDDMRVAEQEEEEKKRKQESSFSAVGFSYGSVAPPSAPPQRKEEEAEDPPLLACYPQQLEHPPSSSVDHRGDGEEEYVPPPGLIIPNNIKPPATMKLHSIIEKTSLFIVKQGAQMEIIIKAKQKYNPFFSFLNHNDELFPYYQHVKAMLTRGAYVPRQVSPAPPPKREKDSPERTNGFVAKSRGEERGDRETDETGGDGNDRTSGEDRTESSKSVESNDKDEESSGDESDSDDEGGYLHPLLMGGALKNSSKPSTPTPGTRESSPAVQNVTSTVSTTTSTAASTCTTTHTTEAYTTSSIAFYSKRLAINSAPVIDTRTTPSTSESVRVATSSHGASAMNGANQHPLQYSYGSGTDPNGNPLSSEAAPPNNAYSDQYGYGNYGHQAHGEYSDAYSSQYNHQYAQDGGYYDGSVAADGTAQYDYQAYYYQSAGDGVGVQYDGSAYSAVPAPPPPVPEDLPVVTKTAEYVAKNGDAFERTVIERHAGDPRFGFLNPWDKGHAYYQMLKQQHRQRLAYEAYSSQMGWNQYPGMGPDAQPPQQTSSYEMNKENIISEPTNLQRLSESGTVSFKLQPKQAKSAFDPSSLVDLGTAEDTGDMDESQRSMEEADGPPPAKKPRAEWNSKMGTKVEEFLSTVKAIIGTE